MDMEELPNGDIKVSAKGKCTIDELQSLYEWSLKHTLPDDIQIITHEEKNKMNRRYTDRLEKTLKERGAKWI